jgi:hypothetical protein
MTEYVLKRQDRGAVVSALASGAYEAITTSSQGALDELVYLASEVGVFEALRLLRVKRQRQGIPDELLLRTLAVLPFVEAMGLSAAAGELFKDAAILLELGYSIKSVQAGFNQRHHGVAHNERRVTPCHPEVLRQELARLDLASLDAFRAACIGELFARKLVKGRIYAIDGSGLHDRYRVVGILNVNAERPLWLSWRVLSGAASEKGKEAQVTRALVADVLTAGGPHAIEWLLMDALYADGSLLAALAYDWQIHALVRLPEDRLLYADLQSLAQAHLIDWQTHLDVRYLSGHKQVRKVAVAMANDLTSWDSYIAAATARHVQQPALWGALIHSVDVAVPTDVEDWALVATHPFPSAWAGYRLWRKRWHIENNGFRELKEGWHLELAAWSRTNTTVIAARVTFTLIAFNVAQLAKTAQGRKLTHRGIRRLRRDLPTHYGPAPVVVFTYDAFAVFHIEEVMAIVGLAPKHSLRRPSIRDAPPLS